MRLIAVAVLVASFAIGQRMPPGTPAQAAATMSPGDRLIAAPRGNPATAIEFAERVESSRIADVRAYITEVYRLAPIVGLDPSIIVAQSAHETGYWKSAF
jgi:hypothetical protein